MLMPSSPSKLRSSKPLLVLEMVRDHRLARLERIARRRVKVSAYARDANKSRVPADSCTKQQPVLCGQLFEHFAQFRIETLGSHTDGGVQKLLQRPTREARDAELG